MAMRATNQRFVIALLGALLLALWSVVGIWSWSKRQSTLEGSRHLLEQLTVAVEEQSSRMFKLAETSLVVCARWIAEHPDEDPASAPGFIALVEDLRKVSNTVIDIRMVDKSGGLHYIPRRQDAPLADVSDRDYFKAQSDPKTRGLFVARAVLSRVSGKWGLPISIPVDHSKSDVAVLFAAIELDRIIDVFEAERQKPTGAIAILRELDASFLFRAPMDEKLLGRSIAQSAEWQEELVVKPRGLYVSDSRFTDQVVKQVAFAHLKDYPLVAVVTAGIDDTLASWRYETAILVAIAAAMSVVGTVLALVLLRSMRAEEAAQRETERAHRHAQLILGAAGDGICGVDAVGMITFANPAADRMLGWKGQIPIGASLHCTVHHTKADGAPYLYEECPVCQTLGDGQTRDVQGEIFWRADGTSFPVEFVVTQVVEGGSPIGAVMVFRDVSEHHEAARILRHQAEELSRSNADLEQFAYVASHDLREPLRQVSSYVSLLERRYSTVLDEDGREFIRYAREGAKRLDRLIIDLLEFSRVGWHPPATAPVSLDEVVDEACAMLKTAIIESGASVSRADLGFNVVASREEMIRLFQNLIGNALKYRDAARSPVVQVTAALENDERVISVTDNGIGIDPEFGERIFGIFQRLHTRESYEGTGIGLAIAKKIVERRGGRIWVEPAPGGGSIFKLTLPS
ncbi:Signal transduction histidine kinase [Candidatus Terasakiella magnetica]|nr:Signal transduction histidine kinase [Candidatus Terasakiella magnetica]